MATTTVRQGIWLTASALMTASAVPASAEVYLNESQALAVVLGEKAIVRREEKLLDEPTRARLERATNLRFPESSYSFFISTQDGRTQKYAVVLNEIGKSEPITFMVGMTPEGKVTDVVIMVFRENRGWEVKEKRFLNQFRGKTLRNAIRVDEDIINYTGATLSSKAIARGVKRALTLQGMFYPGEASHKLAAPSQFAQPLPLSPLATVSDGHGNLGLYRQSRYLMGTICEIRVWCRSAAEAYAAYAAGFAEISRIERVFSAYRGDSELSFVNRNAGIDSVVVSEEFFRLTRDAIRYWRESSGAVDITVAPLLRAWGFQQGVPRVPSAPEILEARSLVGCNKLRLHSRSRTLQFQHCGMELDFGGLAKGYAARQVARMLQKSGAVSVLVNLGRSSFCASRVAQSSQKLTGAADLALGEWPIGVAHPDGSPQCPVYFVLRPGWSLSTSGTSERQFDLEGRKLSHILDPRSGLPLEDIRSATVIAPSGPRAEMLSKLLFFQFAVQSSRPVPRIRGFDWVHLDLSRAGVLAIHSCLARTPCLLPSSEIL